MTNWDLLYNRAYKQFDCNWLSSVNLRDNKISERQYAKRIQKKNRVFEIINRLRTAMDSDTPPRTKAEAVGAVAPFLMVLLSMMFKQFMVLVIEWAWDQLHRDESMTT